MLNLQNGFIKMNISRNQKTFISVIIDLLAVILAYVVSAYIRLDENAFNYVFIDNSRNLCIFIASGICANFYFKIHRGIWRYFSSQYFMQIINSAAITCIIFMICAFAIDRLENFPRSLLILNFIFQIIFTAAPRYIYKMLNEKQFNFIFNKNYLAPQHVLIVGLNPSSVNYIAEIIGDNKNHFIIAGIIDEKENIGRFVSQYKVLGTIDDIGKIVVRLAKQGKEIKKILVNSDIYVGKKLVNLMKIERELSIPIFKIPNVVDINNTSPLKTIAIEDLLGRKQKNINLEQMRQMIKGKRILVTGAGGSIGSEIVRQVAKLSPYSIALLDNSEFLLYEIEQECVNKFPTTEISAHLADIRNVKILEEIFAENPPEVIFHAAALKHVPLLEKHVVEAVYTNIMGTKNIVDTAIKYDVERFVMISTDKAVDPLSFMGMTKKIAESYCQIVKRKNIAISVVRFGNVLGSNGSVVPLFQKQISMGGPVTVTHKDATRYFMTIPEAVRLVIQAASINDSCEKSKVFVLDMGEPVSVHQLARQMIQLAGLTPDVDMQIKFIGLRPGEKLHEILVTEQEPMKKTEHSDILLAQTKQCDPQLLLSALAELKKACDARDKDSCIALVKKIIT